MYRKGCLVFLSEKETDRQTDWNKHLESKFAVEISELGA